MRNRIRLAGASCVAILLGTGATLAADLPYRKAPPPIVAVPVFSWTGVYAGVNAGGGFVTDNNGRGGLFGNFLGETVPVPGGALAPLTLAPGFNGTNTRRGDSGFTGGGQIGVNYQFGAGSGFVVGLEGDIQYTDFANSRTNGNNNGIFSVLPSGGAAIPGFGVAPTVAGGQGNIAFFNGGLNGTRNMDYYGTIRGRLGYAFDRVLVYATGGAAFFDNGSNNNGLGPVGGAAVPGPFFVSAAAAAAGSAVVATNNNRNRGTDVGWTVGGGVEYAFTDSITTRIEGFYVNRDGGNRNRQGGQVVGVSNTGAPILATTFNRRNEDSFAVVRAGLNYKFNFNLF